MVCAVVLCGGRSTRLPGPPKALREVAGRPYISHKLDSLHAQGVDEAMLLVGPYRDAFRDALGGTVELVGDEHLGTGGALVAARHALPDAFWLTYGDSLLGCAVGEPATALSRSDVWASMLVCSPDPSYLPEANVVTLSAHWPSEVQQFCHGTTPGAQWVDYGMIAMRQRLVDTFVDAPDALDLTELMAPAISGSKVLAWYTQASLYHINTPLDLIRTECYLEDLRRRPRSD